MKESWVKILGTIIGILLFIVLVSGLTYAYYNGQATANINGTAACFNINYTKGSDIGSTVDRANVLLFDESDIISSNMITIKNGMAITNFSAGLSSDCEIRQGYITVNANITNLNAAFISGNSVGAFKYVIASYSATTYPTVTTNALNNVSFNILSSGVINHTGIITLYEDDIPYGSKNDYLVIFYINGDLAMNDGGNTNFSATITATATYGSAPTS